MVSDSSFSIKQHSGRKLLFILFMLSGVPVNLITEIF
jgi:hypothetical protein